MRRAIAGKHVYPEICTFPFRLILIFTNPFSTLRQLIGIHGNGLEENEKICQVTIRANIAARDQASAVQQTMNWMTSTRRL